MAEQLVYRKALKQFVERVDGQIIVGDPKHPDVEGKFPRMTKARADALANMGFVGKTNVADPEQENYDFVEGEGEGLDGGNTGASTSDNPNGATPIDGRNSAQAVTERAVQGEPVTKAQTPRGKGRGRTKRTDKGVPAGGRQTTATTRHPPNSSPSTGAADNDGVDDGPVGDEAPTGGEDGGDGASA